MFLVTKNYKSSIFFLNALKVEILFYSMINMKLNFHFNIINFKYEHFHVDLNRFYKIAYTSNLILKNGLQVHEILNVFYFQVIKALKTYLCTIKLCML
jgi:hypothetical protein